MRCSSDCRGQPRLQRSLPKHATTMLEPTKNPFLLSLCPSLEPKKDYGLTVLPLVLLKVVSRLSAYLVTTVRSLIPPFSQHFCACNSLLGSNRLIGRLSGNTARRPYWSAFARLLYKAAWAVEKRIGLIRFHHQASTGNPARWFNYGTG